MTDNEIIKALECCCLGGMSCPNNCPLYDYEGNCWYQLKKPLLGIINRQNAEIERLQGCIKSEDEVREIVKSQMFDVVRESAEKQFNRAISIGRHEAILEVLNWLVDLFPEDKNFTIISRFTVKQKYKELVGETNAPCN